MDRFFSGVRSLAIRMLIVSVLVAVAGCQERQQQAAVGLYVDAVMLNEQNKKDEAIEKLNLAVEKNPRFSIAYSMLGDIYRQMADYENSAASYKKATQLNPWSFNDFYNLGKVCRLMQNFTEAAGAYVRACDLEPEHFEAHLNSAKVFHQLQDYDRAIEYGVIARGISPDNGEVEKALGDIYEAKKDHTQAIGAYKRALELQGNDPKIMISLALAYLRSGGYGAGVELLKTVTNIDPGNSIACQHLGYAYLRLRQMDDAADSYSRAIEINENDAAGYKGLGVVYMLKFQDAKAAGMDNEAEEFKLRAMENWSRSLDIDPTQSKLLKLYKKYSQ